MASSFLVSPSTRQKLAQRVLQTLSQHYEREQTSRRMPWKAAASLALTAITTSSAAFYVHNENHTSHAGVLTSSSSADDGENVPELEKVRLAQLVHDLHLLASSAQNKNVQSSSSGSIRRYLSVFRDNSTSTGVSPLRLQCGTIEDSKDKGKLSLKLPPNLLSEQLDSEVCESLIHAIKAGGTLSLSSFTHLLKASKSALMSEKTVLDLTAHDDVFVVGDLHGDLASLSTVLRLIGDLDEEENTKKTVVFDGDFVDRGTESLQVLVILLLLKLTYPNQVFLLRGNHEDSLIASVYGFQDEVRQAYGSDNEDRLWELITHTFASLPVAATTDNALIVHGGIPSSDFEMEQLENVTAEQRAQVLTTARRQSDDDNDCDDTTRLLQNVLWSDPDVHEGVTQNSSRGVGICFGPEIAMQVLKRHGKQYLVRSHQVMSQGMGVLDCCACGCKNDGGYQVLTVFSNASYPAGQGQNLGAIVRLHSQRRHNDNATSLEQQKQQGYTAITFARDPGASQNHSQAVQRIRSLIAANQDRLATAFESSQNWLGYVTLEQWCTILGHEMELPEMPWKVLHPHLVTAPASSMTVMGHTMIAWKSFLDEHALNQSALLQSQQQQQGAGAAANNNNKHIHMAALQSNHEMLRTVFAFLNRSQSGGISRGEFKRGVELLNCSLLAPHGRQELGDIDHLFDILDKDGSGQIDFAKFEQVFEVM